MIIVYVVKKIADKIENNVEFSEDKHVDIEKFKLSPLKKIKQKNNYPCFPKYDSEDDLL